MKLIKIIKSDKPEKKFDAYFISDKDMYYGLPQH